MSYVQMSKLVNFTLLCKSFRALCGQVLIAAFVTVFGDTKCHQ